MCRSVLDYSWREVVLSDFLVNDHLRSVLLLFSGHDLVNFGRKEILLHMYMFFHYFWVYSSFDMGVFVNYRFYLFPDVHMFMDYWFDFFLYMLMLLHYWCNVFPYMNMLVEYWMHFLHSCTVLVQFGPLFVHNLLVDMSHWAFFYHNMLVSVLFRTFFSYDLFVFFSYWIRRRGFKTESMALVSILNNQFERSFTYPRFALFVFLL
jgi:hypothetical protein